MFVKQKKTEIFKSSIHFNCFGLKWCLTHHPNHQHNSFTVALIVQKIFQKQQKKSLSRPTWWLCIELAFEKIFLPNKWSSIVQSINSSTLATKQTPTPLNCDCNNRKWFNWSINSIDWVDAIEKSWNIFRFFLIDDWRCCTVFYVFVCWKQIFFFLQIYKILFYLK